MSATPARPGRTKRLTRAMGLDGNPLRRGTDRVLAWLGAGMVATFLTAGPLTAIGPGISAYHAARTQAQAQAAARHSVQAVLLQPTAPYVPAMATIATGSQTSARARWTGPGGTQRTGWVPAPPGLPVRSAVTVWLDRSGHVTDPPVQPGQIAERVIVAAAAVPTALAVSLLVALWVARRITDRRRMTAWEKGWSTVEPEWTRRG